MNDVVALLYRLEARDVHFRADKGRLLFDAPEGALTDDDLDALRRHKLDLLALLRQREQLRHRPPEWHAKRVAEVVEREICCLFWSVEFSEIVAFVLDDTYRPYVPCGVVVYTVAELEAFSSGMSGPVDLALLHSIHRAKRVTGGAVKGITDA